jgi:hypothetical protein
MFAELREKWFARRAIRQLLNSHSAVHAERPDLSGRALYKEILLRGHASDSGHADQILQEAEDSLDDWSERDTLVLDFRQVVHAFIVAQFLEAGHHGTVTSFKDIVDSLIPADM